MLLLPLVAHMFVTPCVLCSPPPQLIAQLLLPAAVIGLLKLPLLTALTPGSGAALPPPPPQLRPAVKQLLLLGDGRLL